MTPLYPIIVAQADPFQQYPGMETQAASSSGKGGGKGGGGNPHNPVPESAAYGCVLVGLMVIVFMAARTLRKAHGCCGGGCHHG